MHGRARRTATLVIAALVGALTLGACSSSPSTSPGTGTSTTAPASTSTTSPKAAITAAIVTYSTAAGIEQGNYEITDIDVSSVDPTWAQFSIGPISTDQATFQGGYGFVHLDASGWRVTGIGTADVGCPLTPPTNASAVTYVMVPPAVLSGFGKSCPG